MLSASFLTSASSGSMPGLLDRLAHRLEVLRGGVDREALGLGLDVLGPGLEGDLHQLVLGGLLRGDRDDAPGLEHVGDAARVAQVAAVLA